MSELTSILSGARNPGVYVWPAGAPADDVRREVEGAGWRFFHLDTARVEGKEAFLDRAAAAFGLPRWFGRNWDALADSLGDVRAERGTVVLWDAWSDFARADEQSFSVALDVVRRRAGSALGGAFVVLLSVDEGSPDGPHPGTGGLDPRA